MSRRLRLAAALAAGLAIVASIAAVAGGFALRAMLAGGPPAMPFDPERAPPAPDYGDPRTWAALPDRFDGADVVPPDSHLQARQERAGVDVFFVHPTTHLRAHAWNAAVDDPLARLLTDRGVLPQQASVFNSAGRVFAPRYRQRALGGSGSADGAAALALAYSDVLRAFDLFVEHHNQGRPILLAGHSQGSRHLLRLLDERFRAGPLRGRLVAAYAIGTRVPADPDGAVLPVCRHPMQTGCLVAWQTVLAPALVDGGPPGPPGGVCVNPLHWRDEQEPAPADANLGALPGVGLFGLSPLEPGLVGARCRDGLLEIDRRPGAGYRLAVRDGDDYHAYDYNLFYANLRRNARNRAEGFLRSRPPSGGPPATPAAGRGAPD